MKFSTRVEYGVLALTDIALHSENGSSVSAPDIAERQGVSQKYLEQILTHLKQAGMIRAQKGLRGGYALARPAEGIRMSEILDALDNSILEDTRTENNGGTLRDAVNVCLWRKMNRSMIDFAENKMFSEFLTECREQLREEWDDYVI
ncbi:MAG: Rrf2 family transcriptional regulator [Clostridiales bacterium]|nr:Rrf2 family transcriptional regulator [Clostridiales bacterium]